MFLLIIAGVILLLLIVSEPVEKNYEDYRKSYLEIELKV